MILVQLLLVCALLAAVMMTGPIRQWLRQRSFAEKFLGGGFLGLMILGQGIGYDYMTFPFVNWSMYTHVDESPEFRSVVLKAITEDGTETEINPIQHYPSLVHCFTPRFVRMVEAAEHSRLTENGEAVYRELIDSIAREKDASIADATNRVKCVDVYLVTIDKKSQRTVNEKLISRHQYPSLISNARLDQPDVFVGRNRQ